MNPVKKYALVGKKLDYSISPMLHEFLCSSFPMFFAPATYDVLEMNSFNIEEIIKNYDGLNITIPYKRDAFLFCADHSRLAKDLESVNTIDKNAKGHNTDAAGFGRLLPARPAGSAKSAGSAQSAGLAKSAESVKAGEPASFSAISPAGAVILGTGASAAMAAMVLEKRGVSSITMVSRSIEPSGPAADSFSGHRIIDYGQLESSLRRGDFKDCYLINCTPMGTRGFPDLPSFLLVAGILNQFSHVADLVYNPSPTKLVRSAKNAGLTAAGGLRMLVIQAVLAQEIWNGICLTEKQLDMVCERAVDRLNYKN